MEAQPPSNDSLYKDKEWYPAIAFDLSGTSVRAAYIKQEYNQAVLPLYVHIAQGSLSESEAARLTARVKALLDWLQTAEVHRYTGALGGALAVIRDEDFPADLQAQATSLYERWYSPEPDGAGYEDDLISDEADSDEEDEEDTEEDIDTDVYGHRGINPGQGFRTRASLRRSGGHGLPVCGVSGKVTEGADAVVITSAYNSMNVDEDPNGNVVWYAGTGSNSNDDPNSVKVVDGLRRLRRSEEVYRAGNDSKPVRVFRKRDKRVRVRNIHAPPSGYRYDGLYHVTAKRERHRTPGAGKAQGGKIEQFKLVRVPEETEGSFAQPSLAQCKANWDPAQQI